MTDDRGWGPKVQCPVMAPDGQQCDLAEGHEGNHLNAFDNTQDRVRWGQKLYLIVAFIVALAFLAGTRL
jgi:hypothetical protein